MPKFNPNDIGLQEHEYYGLDDLPGEEWRIAYQCERRYFISSLGRMKSFAKKYPRILCPAYDRKGYLFVGVRFKGRKVSRPIHRMVAFGFLGIPPEGATDVNHKDGNKINNRTENLEWTSHVLNMKHAKDMGLMRFGEKHGQAVLTNSIVKELRIRVGNGEQIAHVASEFNVSQSTARNAVYGRTWTHIPGALPKPVTPNWAVGEDSSNARLTEEQVVAMRQRRLQGATFQVIADEFGVNDTTAWGVIRGRRWDHVPGAITSDEFSRTPDKWNPSVKLTRDDVIAIRHRYKVGGITYEELALQYSVSVTTVGNAVTGKTWKHIREGLDD